MPYTLNGIGTTYYGKKHLERHHGRCEHCGYQGELLSYETRLWFAFLFIPVIPLGKKQILDYCPKCRRHRAIALQDWQQIGEDALTKRMAELSEKPDDPQVAIQAHETLIFFNKTAEATKLANLMAERFPDTVDVQLHLGAWYERQHQEDRANTCFERALQAEPDNPYARRAVAIGYIQKDRLENARELLSCMETPGPHQEPSALFLLASAYQQKGRHNDALAIFQTINRLFPDFAQKDKAFRRAVRASEKSLGKRTSTLPKAQLNWNLIAGAIAIPVIIAGTILANYYLKTHQPLYIVNQFPVQASITISDREEIRIPSYHMEKMTLPEGMYSISVNMEDGISEIVEVTLENSLAQRVSQDNAFILNVGGSTVLLWEKTTYSENPDLNDTDAYQYRFYLNDRFLTFRAIDYLFEEFPEEISIDTGSSAKKTRLSIFDGITPSQFLNIMDIENLPRETILTYAESHLLANPFDEDLIQSYYGHIAFYEMLARGLTFLQQKLSQRPVLIEWHRMYQMFHQAKGTEETLLLEEYDALLAESPDDSALLYLRGRIEPNGRVSLEYYDRSIQADPVNPYPWFARAYFWASQGDFAKSRKDCFKASDLKPNDHRMKEFLFYLQFGLGEYEELEKEVTEILKENPLDTPALNKLLQIRFARDDREGAKTAYEQFLTHLKTEMPDDPYALEHWARKRFAYISEDLTEYRKILETIEDQENKEDELFYLFLLQTDMDAVESLIKDPEQRYFGYRNLLVSLGWILAGNAEKAETWLQHAVKSFRNSANEEHQIAQLLESQEDKLLDIVDDLSIEPEKKAILYAALAVSHPSERHELLSRADTLNVLREPPYLFLKKVINSLQSDSAL